jgi:hypothetical protein
MTFVVCKKCYRGQRYCSKPCRTSGYKAVRKKARLKFEKSIEAKLDHRDRSKLYRFRKKEMMSVTDQTSNQFQKIINDHSTTHANLLNLKDISGVCISCKQTVFNKGVHIYGGPV